MATRATRMILSRNGKSFPLHLLRGSLLGGSNNITSQFIFDPAVLQPQQKPIFNLLGDRSNVGLGGDINGVLNWRFDGFGEMGRVEASGKRKTVKSDEVEVEDEDEDDSEDVDDDEDIKDFDEDEDEEDEDGGDFDDDDVIDVRKRM